MRAAISAAALAACLLATSALGAEQPVGDWGDPERLVIEGAKSFPPEEIRNKLICDFQVLLASHPLAPRSELVPTIQQRLLAGYLKSGFADANVAVRMDEAAGRIVATVHEGPRYTTAGVRIEGAHRAGRDELHQRLTAPYPPKKAVRAEFYERSGEREVRWFDKDGNSVDLEGPVWTPGKPAAFDESSRKRRRDHVRDGLAELGYPFATFDAAIIPHPETRTAELVVVLADEGPPAEVREIEITGAEKNTRAEILAHLEIEPGELITHRRRVELEHRLWESGRFLEQQVILTPPQENVAAKLRIELKEYPHAPPLGKALSREQATLLKMRHWLMQRMQAGEADFVLQAVDERGGFEVVLSPRQGIILEFTGAAAAGQARDRLVALISQDEVGIYAPGEGFRLSGKVGAAQLTGHFALSSTGKGDKPFNFGLSMGVRTLEEDEEAAPLETALSIAPVFCLALAHEDNARTSWREELLTVESDRRLVCVDSRDGRLVEYKTLHPESREASSENCFVAGAFSRRRRELLEEVKDAPNRFEPARPVSSLVAGALHEDVLRIVSQLFAKDDRPAPDLTRLEIVRSLAERGVLQPLDEALTMGAETRKDGFDIPVDADHPAAPANFLGYLAVGIALPAAEQLFPRESWPWTISRETALTVAGRPSYLGPELHRLYTSHETGPVCSLTVAMLLRYAGMNNADAFAARGLAALDVEAFLRDCRPLLDPGALSGQCLSRAAEVLRTLDEADVEALARDVLRDDAAILIAAGRELRRDRSARIEQSLPRALAAAWEAGLQRRIEGALESFLPDDTFRLGGQP